MQLPYHNAPRRGNAMTMTCRVLLCAGILLVDLAVFFLPLTAFFLVYILLVNPPWFREFLAGLDGPSAGRREAGR
jgi:hypothetical protein